MISKKWLISLAVCSLFTFGCSDDSSISVDDEGGTEHGGDGGGDDEGGGDGGGGGEGEGGGEETKPEPVRLNCGDGNLDDDEECDDGNKNNGDGCTSNCSREAGWRCEHPGDECEKAECGDKVVDKDEGEACDNGSSNRDYTGTKAGCSTSCQPSHYCGDGLVDDIDRANGELCDDKGASAASGGDYNICNVRCVYEGRYCGDKLITHDETCDDGNNISGDGCSSDCQIEKGYTCPGIGSPDLGKPCEPTPSFVSNCGNGVVDADEECDDGNTTSGDGCSVACQMEPGYKCSGKPSKCETTVCGDGVIEGSEKCEDGNNKSGDGCSEKCQIEPGWTCAEIGKACYATKCGDGVVAGKEECDDGNDKSEDGCSRFCKREPGYHCNEKGGACEPDVCGDGVITGDEKCDDGNKTSKDGCSDKCQIEDTWECLKPGELCTKTAECNNGRLQGAEQCDDPDNASSCCDKKTCKLKDHCLCDDEGHNCVLGKCGDGIVQYNEECDDGNMKAGDGCDPFCHREAIYSCDISGECKPICGDGIWVAGELCDDGNLESGDGCSSECVPEDGWTCDEYSNDYLPTVKLAATYRDFRAWDDSNCTGANGDKVDGCLTPDEAKKYGGAFSGNQGHPDFQRINASEKNIVKDTLGSDGRPVFNASSACGITANSFDMWYHDYEGINYKIEEPLELKLTDKDKGEYVYDDSNFFPLSGRGYGNYKNDKNFHFTTHIQTYFQYQGKPAKLLFRGDDDVFVFVNGKRAIDLGGCHNAEEGSFEITATKNATTGKMYDPKYDLYEGGIYPISFFQAERYTDASNFRLTLVGFVNVGKTNCRSVCGDGLVRDKETCDLGGGHVNDQYAIEHGCVNCQIEAYCGNGIVEGNEGCDQVADWCQNCVNVNCGDGVVQEYEQCDDGKAKNGTAASKCLSNCRLAGCRNGILEDGEECDDGNEVDDDNCSNSCKRPYCGDHIVQRWLGEVCDDGVNDSSYNGCGAGCTFLPPRCGDARIDTMNGEVCDDGANTGAYGTCTSDCKLAPYCGDGKLQADFEECDEGELNGTPGHCPAACRTVVY